MEGRVLCFDFDVFAVEAFVFQDVYDSAGVVSLEFYVTFFCCSTTGKFGFECGGEVLEIN